MIIIFTLKIKNIWLFVCVNVVKETMTANKILFDISFIKPKTGTFHFKIWRNILIEWVKELKNKKKTETSSSPRFWCVQ